jgi:HAD superfamily hydrolase (TIGR01509 family)
MPVRAVLFDLGDTLIFQAHEPDRAALYDQMSEQLAPLLRSWQVGAAFDVVALLTELFPAIEMAQQVRREHGYEVDAAFVARGALAAYGIDVTDEQSKEFWRACAVDLRLFGWQLYPDSIDTLQRVHALGLKTGLVSNSFFHSDTHSVVLGELGLTLDVLDAIVLSTDVMRPKPRPEPFERALALLDVPAPDAVFIGDVLEVDISGAKRLGMTTVWKLNGRHEMPSAEDADHTIHDLWELFTIGVLPTETTAALPQQSLWPHEDDNADRY